MTFDLILRQGRIAANGSGLVDIGMSNGRIAGIGSALETAQWNGVRELSLHGRLLVPGFVESHIHLDKSCIGDRCACRTGTLREAIEAVAAAKRDFTEEDIYARARGTLEKAIVQGTTRMRCHTEVDPRIGLKAFNALSALKRDYAWAVDLQICVFPQEGLNNDPGTFELLQQACEAGADLIGGCPYTDSDPVLQIARIFELAKRFDLDIDFHLDFDLDPSWMHLEEVCRQSVAHGWQGRVAVGHVTKLSALEAPALQRVGGMLRDAGVAVTVLPATDLFLMGRDAEHSVPRGVAPAHRLREMGVDCSLATNNVLNPFTPFGDCSLIRIANLYANVAQIGRSDQLEACLDMITAMPARLMNLKDYGIALGKPADIVVLDCSDGAAAIAELAPPILGIKHGRISFSHPAAVLHRPDTEAAVLFDQAGRKELLEGPTPVR